jgi:molecular chaperone GrpE
VIAVASLFRRSERVHGDEDDAHAAKTIEVSAKVIADAVREANSCGGGATASGGANPAEHGDARIQEELLAQALAERGSLVQLCLYALDRARSSGVAERIEEGLASVGVNAVRPDGQRFDPAHHEAGGTVSTEDAELDGVVAETEVVGFADRGRLLRAPVVTVYTTRDTTT